MRPLRQCLLDTYLVRLRVIAGFWDIELTADQQRDIAAELSTAMASADAVAPVWEGLSAEHRRALEALLASDGHMPRRVFARQWGEIRTMGPGRMERDQPWEQPVSPAEALWYRGLIFLAFEQGPDGAYEVVFVPPELQVHLPRPDRSQSAVTLEPTSVPATVLSAGDAFLEDACTLLAYLHNEPVRPSAEGKWPSRHTTRLTRRLHAPDPERFALLRHLAHRLGWLHESESGHLRPEPDSVIAWLRSPASQQRQAVAAAWRDDPAWNDLFHVPGLLPEDTGAWRNDPLTARRAILHHLARCAPGKWYRIEHFIAAVKEADPDFQRPDGDYTTWYIRDASSGAYLSGFGSWDAVEGALIRYLITRPLAWLGLVGLGCSDTDGAPTTFQLTAGGSAFLGLSQAPPAPERDSLDLRPGFIVRVPSGRRYERFQLSRVADWVRTGDPFLYRFTPGSLDRARQQGISVRRALEFLEEATDAPVPRHVEAALTRWKARGVEARLEQTVLLRLSSEELMDQAMASPRVRRFVQEQIGATAALVRKGDWPHLVAALGQIGLLPEIVGLGEDPTNT